MLNADNNDANRLRVFSCQQVIKDVSRRLSREEMNPRLIAQLNRLQELLALVDYQAVSENELGRLEISTNQLLQELSGLFHRKQLGSLYGESKH